MASTPKSFLGKLEFQPECIKALEIYYWLQGRYSIDIRPKCKRCKLSNVHLVRKMDEKPDLYQCNSCKKQFNVLTNTPFQFTKVQLPKWFQANWYYKRPWDYKIEDIAKKILLNKRDTKNLIKNIKKLDENYKLEKGRVGFGFLWAVRRKYLNYKERMEDDRQS